MPEGGRLGNVTFGKVIAKNGTAGGYFIPGKAMYSRAFE